MTNLKNNKHKAEEAHIEPDQTTNEVLIPGELLNLSTSINEIIKGIDDIENFEDLNAKSSKEIYNKLLGLELWELLSIKANLEKADKVNFLVDEEKICKRFILDKDTTSMIVPMIAILISLFVLATNQKNILLQCLFGISIIILLILKYKFISIESKRSSKPTDNKYKVFQYLVDIAIENKKKELN